MPGQKKKKAGAMAAVDALPADMRLCRSGINAKSRLAGRLATTDCCSVTVLLVVFAVLGWYSQPEALLHAVEDATATRPSVFRTSFWEVCSLYTTCHRAPFL